MTDYDQILSKFGVFSGLTGAALTAAGAYCRDAGAEVSRLRAGEQGGDDALNAYAAALAYYRYALAALSGSSSPRVGHIALADSATLAAAKELLAQYRAAAAPYLPGCSVAIRQVRP